MDHFSDAGDARSAKRQAIAPSDDSRVAARAVAELDDAIWTSIVEFLPIPRDLQVLNDDYKHYHTSVFQVAATWQTLLDLRVVSRKLAALLCPRRNAAVWRRLVLQGFDFSCDGSLNTENYKDEHGLDYPDDEGDSDEDRNFDENQGHQDQTPVEEMEQDPQLLAMRGRYRNMPPNYLEEDLMNWCKLGIYHRPSQYGLLTTLQQLPPEGLWPEQEDAFTLFGDIVRLLQLPHGDDMGARGEGSETTVKYLAAPTEAGPSSRFYNSYVMKTLGYVPHFWHWGNGISSDWQGFSEPEAMEARIATQLVDEDGMDGTNAGFEDDDDSFEFPQCTVGDAKQLYEHVREHCRDWRSVCCNSFSDGTTPVFFVGESKAAPHRWTGYTGLKCWT